MNEPIDEELREFVDAFRASERPTAAARELTWAGIEARIAAEPAARGVGRGVGLALAIAAMVLLAVGLAAGVPWRGRSAVPVEASHQRGGEGGGEVEEAKGSRAVGFQGGGAEGGESKGGESRAVGLQNGEAEGGESRAVGLQGGELESGESRVVGLQGEESRTGKSEGEGLREGAREVERRGSRGRRVEAEASLRPEEVRSFQRARAALASGDAAAAWVALEGHGRRFPDGFFEAERQLSLVQALCELGRGEEARAARDRFLRERPGSHLGERMRGSCREIE